MKKSVAALLLLLVALSPQLVEAQQQCGDIANAKKRLACYDASKVLEVKEVATKKNSESLAVKDALSEANKTLSALRKLENRIDVGISYRDYPGMLADASNAVREFHDSKNSSHLPDLDKLFLRVDKRYRDALSLWQDKFSYDRIHDAPALIGRTKQLYELLVASYPELTRATYIDNGFMGSGYQHLNYVRGLSIIWGLSSNELRCASEWFKSVDGDNLPDKLPCMTNAGDENQ